VSDVRAIVFDFGGPVLLTPFELLRPAERRLGLAERISETLRADLALPAPGQGALAVEVRAEDPVARPLVARLDDPATRAAVEAERAFLRASGGGCRAPLGALATVDCDTLTIRGAVAAAGDVPDGDAPPSQAALAPGTTFTGRAEAALPAPRVAWGERRGPAAEWAALAAELATDLAATLDTLEPRDPGSARARERRLRHPRRHPGVLLLRRSRGIRLVLPQGGVSQRRPRPP